MERVLCLSHVLQFALPALDEVDDVARLAGCCGLYVVGVAGGGLTIVSLVWMCWQVRH